LDELNITNPSKIPESSRTWRVALNNRLKIIEEKGRKVDCSHVFQNALADPDFRLTTPLNESKSKYS